MLICVFPLYEEIVSDTEDTADYPRGPRVLEQLCIFDFLVLHDEIILSVQIEA